MRPAVFPAASLRFVCAAMLLSVVFATGCRIESAAPSHGSEDGKNCSAPAGDVWIYTSMYRSVVDALDPLIAKKLPGVTVHWYQAGSEKVASRVEAERSAGAIHADLLATSDPFLYARFAEDGLFDRYVSPNAQRVPRALVDLDGRWCSSRLSTMVLVHRKEVDEPPASFSDLIDPKWKDAVALGDPLTSGTAFTWTVFMHQAHGPAFFDALRKNGAVVAGGNAAVLQQVESGEAQVGVLLLENALTAIGKGSPIGFVYPKDGAVVIPGPVAIFRASPNKVAARAVLDVILSPEGQKIIVHTGDMHAVDPRLEGPRGEPGLDVLMERSAPWTEAVLRAGADHGEDIKNAFLQAFEK